MVNQKLLNDYKQRIIDFDETVFYDAYTAYEAGNKDMAYILGLCYVMEIGVARNVRLGLKLLKMSAEQANIDALLALGDVYAGDFGNLVKSDYKSAKKYYQKAADSGDLRAKSSLGNLLYTNHEYLDGFNLVNEAYLAGYRDDAWLLSRYYELGQAVPKDDAMSLKIMLDIVNPGGFELVRIGRMYKNGIGTTADEDLAFKYFSAAATLSFPVGMREVGLCFLLGIGTKKHLDLALKYLKNAADHSDFRALDILAEVNDIADKDNYDFKQLPILADDKIENIMRFLVVRNKLKFTKNLKQ